MQAGWTGLFAVERDPMAFATLQANLLDPESRLQFEWPEWLPKQAYEIGAFNQRFSHKLKALRGQVDLVAGGPPCQGFSFAGLRRKSDRRNQLFKRFLKVIDFLQPKFLLLENVSGINIEHGKKARQENPTRGRRTKAFSHRIRDELYRNHGYAVFGDEIRAEDCGVAQWRPRFFIIGIREDLLTGDDAIDPFAVLDAVRPQFLANKGLTPGQKVSVSEAISDLEIAEKELEPYPDKPRGFFHTKYTGPETHYQHLLHSGMNGHAPDSRRLANQRQPTVERLKQIIGTCRAGVSLSQEDKQRLGGIKKHTVVLLDRGAPAHTLTTLPDDFVHYSEPRILTVREMARLQSFPDWWVFRGKYTTGGPSRTKEAPRYTQVGNAVAPFVAELMGLTLAQVSIRLGQAGAPTPATNLRTPDSGHLERPDQVPSLVDADTIREEFDGSLVTTGQ